jgi:hypothetical protein
VLGCWDWLAMGLSLVAFLHGLLANGHRRRLLEMPVL